MTPSTGQHKSWAQRWRKEIECTKLAKVLQNSEERASTSSVFEPVLQVSQKRRLAWPRFHPFELAGNCVCRQAPRVLLYGVHWTLSTNRFRRVCYNKRCTNWGKLTTKTTRNILRRELLHSGGKTWVSTGKIESLVAYPPLWTPCSWPPWPWFSRERPLKIFKVM